MSIHDSKKIEDIKVLLKKGANGSSIESIEKTGTVVLEDTYTVTLTDGSKTTFKVTNGNGIVSIVKTGSVNKVDTYTITFTDGTTTTFNVTNGADTNAQLAERVTSPAQMAYSVGEYVVIEDTYCQVTAPIAVGDDFEIGVNLRATTVGEELEDTNDNILTLGNGLSTASANFAEIVTSPASKSYAVGDYVVFNGKLCKVSASIAQGDTFAVGTNLTECTVGEKIKDIDGDISSLLNDVNVLNALLADVNAPLTTEGLTMTSGIQVEYGGYKKIGKLVLVQVVVASSLAGYGDQQILYGLPKLGSGSARRASLSGIQYVSGVSNSEMERPAYVYFGSQFSGLFFSNAYSNAGRPDRFSITGMYMSE